MCICETKERSPAGTGSTCNTQNSDWFTRHRNTQWYVLSTFDWQLIHCIVVQHLCYIVERLAKLSQNKTPVVIGYYLHMHEACHTPVTAARMTCYRDVFYNCRNFRLQTQRPNFQFYRAFDITNTDLCWLTSKTVYMKPDVSSAQLNQTKHLTTRQTKTRRSDNAKSTARPSCLVGVLYDIS